MLAQLVLQIFQGRILLRLPRGEEDNPVSQCLGCQHHRGNRTCTEFLRLPSLFWSNTVSCPDRSAR